MPVGGPRPEIDCGLLETLQLDRTVFIKLTTYTAITCFLNTLIIVLPEKLIPQLNPTVI